MNIDALSYIILANLNTPIFSKFAGTFGKSNTGYATLNAPFALPAAMLNQTFTFAFAKISPFDLVSQPTTIRITL